MISSSAVVFGDYYYRVESSRRTRGENGFWIRRMNFAYDDALSRTY
jgi:hypothetical protein